MSRPALHSTRSPVAALEPPVVDAMFALLGRHFDDVERAIFQADLAEKHEVLLLWDEAEQLRGFSTLRFWDDEDRGLTVLFSGDTIVDPAAWGSPVLARAWLDAALAHAARSGRPLWWLLICSGYRTYRFLPTFFREFWPRFDQPTPEDQRRLMEGLARDRYGERFAGGVVRLPGGNRVRPEVGGLTEARLANPHVAYFAAANPGHALGEELVCLTRVCPENLTEAGRRVLATLGG